MNNTTTAPSLGACPCSNPEWCHSVSSARRNTNTSIVFGFAALQSKGAQYNWTHIDVVAWGSDELMCRAHQQGARAVLAAPSFSLNDKNPLNITDWVQKSLEMVQSRHYDGMVFDYESPMSVLEGRLYVALIRATRHAFRINNNNLLVVTCVAWSPDGIDGRSYPYKALAAVSDYLYVMDYDTRSQIFDGPCIASANAPYAGMIHGIQRYLELKIETHKLILGVPWYGYRYPCLEGTTVEAQFCSIPQVPFRGVNCSDAAGSEIAYGTILKVFHDPKKDPQTRSPMRRDLYMDALYFNSLDGGDLIEDEAKRLSSPVVHQYWFDDAVSLAHKFAWAKSMHLGGVGPYTFDDLDPLNFPDESRAMWSAFDAFCSTMNHGDAVEELERKKKL